jgi:peptidoglycan/LPS O-acetylase OafA/YrhL
VQARLTDATSWIADHRRGAFAVGAVLAGIVALVFATVGDGVEADGDGVRGLVVEHAHTAVWALLTGALALAAVRGRWRSASSALAWAALAVYLVFVGGILLEA